MKYLISILVICFLSGCAHERLERVNSVDLSSIGRSADMVKDDIVAKRYPEAIKGVEGLKKEVVRLQGVVDKATERENEIRAEHNEIIADRDMYRNDYWKWMLTSIALLIWILRDQIWWVIKFFGGLIARVAP